MNNHLKDYVVQWLNKAEEDLVVVNELTHPDIVAPSSACFHCQQAVEKFLKAYLIAHNKEIVKTHNIEFLLSECQEIDPEFSHIDPKYLSDFGVEHRYPGDYYLPSDEEIMEYLEITLKVKKLVLSKIFK